MYDDQDDTPSSSELVRSALRRAGRVPRIEGGTDHLADHLAGLEAAPLVVAGILPAREAPETWREYAELSGEGQLRRYLRLMGLNARGLTSGDLLDAVLSRDAGQTSASFGSIVANRARTAVSRGWTAQPATWRRVARVGQVQDFRIESRTPLWGGSLLPKVPENAETPYLPIGDEVQTVQASSYSGRINLTRAALLSHDGRDQLVEAFRAGAAASATIDRALCDLLGRNSGTGPTMSYDATALFASAHANYDASAGAPTVANLDTARQALRKQRDPVSNRRLNTAARLLLVPPELETTAKVLAASQNDVGDAERLDVVVEAGLTDLTNGATAWYALGDPELCDTFEVAFIAGGGDMPLVMEERPLNRDGIVLAIGQDFAIAALSHRAVYRRRGA